MLRSVRRVYAQWVEGDKVGVCILWTKTSFPWASKWVNERASERMSAAELPSEASCVEQANKWVKQMNNQMGERRAQNLTRRFNSYFHHRAMDFSKIKKCQHIRPDCPCSVYLFLNFLNSYFVTWVLKTFFLLSALWHWIPEKRNIEFRP